MIRAGIIGISGYTGKELFDLLQHHDNVRVTYVSANTSLGRLDEIWPDLKGKTDLVSVPYDYKDVIAHTDLVFLALPHTQSMPLVPTLLKAGKKVIDLSADYRLSKLSLWEKWYETKHKDTRNIRKAVYGLPELYRTKIAKSQLVANPGCYPTAAILGLAPLVSMFGNDIQSIVVDAKSGYSGAGKKVIAGLMAGEVNENFKAYKVLAHRHKPEISHYLTKLAGKNTDVTFVPHLLPFSRGIQESIYVHLSKSIAQKKLHTIYKKFYQTEPFVRVLNPDQQPEIKNVVRTNFCDISVNVSDDKKVVVIGSVIDNLTKGASGQAIHNMNIMYGFDEMEGLI